MSTVYPRLRGGSPKQVICADVREGLSPPTRGIHVSARRRAFTRGSIPAYAGDPIEWTDQTWNPAVYPRLRGGSLRGNG